MVKNDKNNNRGEFGSSSFESADYHIFSNLERAGLVQVKHKRRKEMEHSPQKEEITSDTVLLIPDPSPSQTSSRKNSQADNDLITTSENGSSSKKDQQKSKNKNTTKEQSIGSSTNYSKSTAPSALFQNEEMASQSHSGQANYEQKSNIWSSLHLSPKATKTAQTQKIVEQPAEQQQPQVNSIQKSTTSKKQKKKQKASTSLQEVVPTVQSATVASSSKSENQQEHLKNLKFQRENIQKLADIMKGVLAPQSPDHKHTQSPNQSEPQKHQNQHQQHRFSPSPMIQHLDSPVSSQKRAETFSELAQPTTKLQSDQNQNQIQVATHQTPPPEIGQPRQLVKFQANWSEVKKLQFKDDPNSLPYDQFAGKQTNFEFDEYSTQIQQEDLTYSSIKQAMKLENELLDSNDKQSSLHPIVLNKKNTNEIMEDNMSSDENDNDDDDQDDDADNNNSEDQEIVLNTAAATVNVEQKLTAVGIKQQEIDHNNQSDDEESQYAAVNRRGAGLAFPLKFQLMQALGASAVVDNNQQIMVAPRKRTDSFAQESTQTGAYKSQELAQSKASQLLMSKEDYEQYMAFKQSKLNQTNQHRDRKQSFEYFKDEQKKLDTKISNMGKKKFTCFNKLNQVDTSSIFKIFSNRQMVPQNKMLYDDSENDDDNNDAVVDVVVE